ncbi:MAG: carbohydrate ABC transporter permease [Turicibacter sp.]
MSSLTRKKKITSFLCFIMLLILALIWLTPLVWALLTSFKSEIEVQTIGFSFLPANWVVSNYIEVLNNTTSAPLVKWFTNSLVVSTSHSLLAVGISSMAAYAYSRLEFKGRDLMFWFLLSTMMFPSVVNIIPTYKIVDSLDWVNNLLALIVPGLGGVVNIYLIRQFMLAVPKEYDESARVDGASDWKIFTRIIFPLCKPILIVVGLFAFTGSWNDFLWPSIVMHDMELFTLTTGLKTLQSSMSVQVAHLMTASVLSIVPTLILYLIAQKHFVEGLSLQSGVKG